MKFLGKRFFYEKLFKENVKTTELGEAVTLRQLRGMWSEIIIDAHDILLF